jgi:hypothetical protein
MTLKLVIKQIFEKATDEAHWSSMYAKLCRMLLHRLDPAITEVVDGKPVSGGLLFRKYLVGRCQADFEAGWKAREEASTAAMAKREEDREKQEKNEEGGETTMLSDEYYAEQKAKRRGLGLVQLIGELYKLDMIGKGVIRSCFARLLANVETPDEEDLESTCKLLTTVGEQYDRASPENMEIVFDRLNIVLEGDKVISRIRFMIMVGFYRVSISYVCLLQGCDRPAQERMGFQEASRCHDHCRGPPAGSKRASRKVCGGSSGDARIHLSWWIPGWLQKGCSAGRVAVCWDCAGRPTTRSTCRFLSTWPRRQLRWQRRTELWT